MWQLQNINIDRLTQGFWIGLTGDVIVTGVLPVAVRNRHIVDDDVVASEVGHIVCFAKVFRSRPAAARDSFRGRSTCRKAPRAWHLLPKTRMQRLLSGACTGKGHCAWRRSIGPFERRREVDSSQPVPEGLLHPRNGNLQLKLVEPSVVWLIS